MFELIASLLGGVFGAALSDRRQQRLATERRLRFARGEQVRFPCAVRHHGRTAWLHGELTASRAAGAYWTPPRMKTPRIDLDPARLEVTGVREVGTADALAVNPSFGIMSCRIDGNELDVALEKSHIEMMMEMVRAG